MPPRRRGPGTGPPYPSLSGSPEGSQGNGGPRPAGKRRWCGARVHYRATHEGRPEGRPRLDRNVCLHDKEPKDVNNVAARCNVGHLQLLWLLFD